MSNTIVTYGASIFISNSSGNIVTVTNVTEQSSNLTYIMTFSNYTGETTMMLNGSNGYLDTITNYEGLVTGEISAVNASVFNATATILGYPQYALATVTQSQIGPDYYPGGQNDNAITIRGESSEALPGWNYTQYIYFYMNLTIYYDGSNSNPQATNIWLNFSEVTPGTDHSYPSFKDWWESDFSVNISGTNIFGGLQYGNVNAGIVVNNSANDTTNNDITTVYYPVYNPDGDPHNWYHIRADNHLSKQYPFLEPTMIWDKNVTGGVASYYGIADQKSGSDIYPTYPYNYITISTPSKSP